MPDRRPVAPFSGAGGPVGRGWCRSSARRRHGAIRQEWQGQTAGQGSIGLARAIENPICNPARRRLTWKGPSDRASAGRATLRGSPGPTWKQSLLPAQCGHPVRLANPDGNDAGRTVKPGRQLQAPGRASSLWVRHAHIRASLPGPWERTPPPAPVRGENTHLAPCLGAFLSHRTRTA